MSDFLLGMSTRHIAIQIMLRFQKMFVTNSQLPGRLSLNIMRKCDGKQMRKLVIKNCCMLYPLYALCTYSALGLNASNLRISFVLSTDL